MKDGIYIVTEDCPLWWKGEIFERKGDKIILLSPIYDTRVVYPYVYNVSFLKKYRALTKAELVAIKL